MHAPWGSEAFKVFGEMVARVFSPTSQHDRAEVFIQDVVRRGRAQEERRASRRGGDLKACDWAAEPSGEAMDCCETRLLQAPEVGARYIFGVANKPEVLEEYPLEQVLEPGIFISRIYCIVRTQTAQEIHCSTTQYYATAFSPPCYYGTSIMITNHL